MLRILDVQRAYLDAADGGGELVSTGLLKHSASDGQRLQQSLDEHAGALGSCLVLLTLDGALPGVHHLSAHDIVLCSCHDAELGTQLTN